MPPRRGRQMNLPDWVTAAMQVAGVVGGLIAAACTVVMWAIAHTNVSKPTFDSYRDGHEKVHDHLDQRLDHGEQRFSLIGADLKHAPNFDHVDALRGAIGELNLSVRALTVAEGAMKERFGALEEQVSRILDFHLRGAK